ncbi:Golgi SNAP receptor complex member 1-like protein [Pilaira anomala]|nr:Golgi SNAP receptor complex member 1-like protein [Pilaira anomala]
MQRTSSPSQQPLLDETDMSIISSNSTKSWEQLRKEARSLESEIESKLATLSKVGQSNGLDDVGQESETEELLKKLQLVITGMGDFIDKPSSTPTNPSMIHLLSRHKDILYDYTKEFRRVKGSIKAARDKANLMNQVQDEIRSFNSGNRDNADYYLSERNRVESSHRMTDMILEQAYATRQDVSRQGRIMHGVNQRVGGVVSRIPGINNIISRINTRRKRDTLIMAGVVSTCSILIILYWIHT